MKKFSELNENTISGPFNVSNMTFRVEVDYINDITIVKLLYKDEHYQKLSIKVPDTKKLDKDEFFMDFEVDKKIVAELVKQNFIEKTDKVSKAGLHTIYSYKLV